MSNYDESYLSFARRTKRNLEFIQQSSGDSTLKIYEVTQLVNSLLGLLLFPRSYTWGSFRSYRLNRLDPQQWPNLTNQSTSLDKLPIPHLERVLREMRNAVAHNDIRFIADRNNEIERIVFRNINSKNTDNPYREWVLELTLPELRLLLDSLLSEYERIAQGKMQINGI